MEKKDQEALATQNHPSWSGGNGVLSGDTITIRKFERYLII